MKYIIWMLRLLVAGILLQTLYYKFSGHPDSIFIFEQTGLGQPGRIGIGILELISAFLILIPRTSLVGAVFAIGIISAAIFFHLTKLGIEVNNDGGLLFYLALTVFIGSLLLVYLQKDQISALLGRQN